VLSEGVRKRQPPRAWQLHEENSGKKHRKK